MANIKSQIKRIRTNEKSRLRNKAAKAEVKTRIKSAVRAAEVGQDDAWERLQTAVRRLDKAAARGIIHRNQAANRKSALMRHVGRLTGGLGGASAGADGDSAEARADAEGDSETAPADAPAPPAGRAEKRARARK